MRCINCGAPNPIKVPPPWDDVFGKSWCAVGEHEADVKETPK